MQGALLMRTVKKGKQIEFSTLKMNKSIKSSKSLYKIAFLRRYSNTKFRMPKYGIQMWSSLTTNTEVIPNFLIICFND